MSPAELDALAEAVATRVLAQLRAEPAAPPSQPAGLADAATLARALGVTPAYVYANSGKLGAVRLGSGPKPRLRFDVGEAVKAHTGRESERPAPAALQTAKPRPRRAASSAGLLPIRGRAARARATANAEETHDAA